MGQPHHHPAVLPIRLSEHSHDRCGCFLYDNIAPDNTVPYNYDRRNQTGASAIGDTATKGGPYELPSNG